VLTTTLPRLCCPNCGQELILRSTRVNGPEVVTGTLQCKKCKGQYPILAGVAILVSEPAQYLLEHVKGVSQLVPDSEIPPAILEEYQDAKAQVQNEHIEEDLEAERVVALYLMNHYLRVQPREGHESDWWKPNAGTPSPLIDELVKKYWDAGPMAKIVEWIGKLPQKENVVELGCGVAGLAMMLRGQVRSYLGVDGSFTSIALGRHLALGTPYPKQIRIPGDLLHGQVGRKVQLPKGHMGDGQIDLVVGDLAHMPVRHGQFDIALALNAIDMMPQPEDMIHAQHELLKKGGAAIQSCPYIWHSDVARELRRKLPKEIKDSAKAVEWLYEKVGFQIQQSLEHLPWLFFKQVRQLEIYSVHLFQARKTG
jgi:SAM-dependent methyltransferase/uncharacterized protein YbaR (Trm112 family)